MASKEGTLHNGENSEVKLQLKQLTPTIGALVEGINLSTPLDNPTVEALKAAFHTHHVLFFRNQDLDPPTQRDFTAKFGKLYLHPFYPRLPDYPEVVVLDTGGHNPPEFNVWHFDGISTGMPPLGSTLHAKIIPETGGDTLWSSMIAAYEALSEPFRTFLDGLQAVHDFAKGFKDIFYNTPEKVKIREESRLKFPPVALPLIRTHPVTGRKGIFVNESSTTHILNLTPKESDMILQFLFAHIQKLEFTIRWNWRVGDVVLWDNRSTQHIGLDDYLPNRRVMHRVSIEGEKPF